MATLAARSAELEAVAAAATTEPGVRIQRLYGGLSAITELVTLPDGRQAVRKRPARWSDPDDARHEVDAEVLAARLADVLGAPVPAVQYCDGVLWIEYVDGDPVRQEALDGPAAVRIGLLDALCGNPDRGGNLFRTSTGPVGFDHGAAWLPVEAGPFRLENAALARLFVTDDGIADAPPITASEVAELRTRVEALAADFAHLGRSAWLTYTLTQLDNIAEHARPTGRHDTMAHEPRADQPIWRPDGTGVQSGGDIEPEFQVGDSYSVRYVLPARGGRLAQTTITWYAMDVTLEPDEENPEPVPEYAVGRHNEWRVITDGPDPQEVWSDTQSDNFEWLDGGMVYDTAEQADADARAAAEQHTADDIGWDGKPDRWPTGTWGPAATADDMGELPQPARVRVDRDQIEPGTLGWRRSYELSTLKASNRQTVGQIVYVKYCDTATATGMRLHFIDEGIPEHAITVVTTQSTTPAVRPDGVQKRQATKNAAGGETTSLSGTTFAVETWAGAARDAARQLEASIATLRTAGVGAAVLTALSTAQQAYTAAATDFEQARTALEPSVQIGDAYHATPDAGDKHFVQPTGRAATGSGGSPMPTERAAATRPTYTVCVSESYNVIGIDRLVDRLGERFAVEPLEGPTEIEPVIGHGREYRQWMLTFESGRPRDTELCGCAADFGFIAVVQG